MSTFKLIRCRKYSVMIEHGVNCLKLHAMQQSSPSRGPGVFAFQLVVGDQARIGGLACRVSAGDEGLWMNAVGIAARISSNTSGDDPVPESWGHL